MQAFFWAVVRAFTKFGMAMAASNPMIATTIMISTSVKPDLRFVLICIVLTFFFYAAVNVASGGYLVVQSSFTDCRSCRTAIVLVAPAMPSASLKKLSLKRKQAWENPSLRAKAVKKQS